LPVQAQAIKVLHERDNADLAGDAETAGVLEAIARRKDSIRPEHDRFVDLCDRFDNLYYANELTTGGADHWPEDPNRRIVGKAHISVNVHPTYVDVPAALQSVIPIENVVPPESNPEAKAVASAVERLYFVWKDEDQFETKAHKMATVKSLYGKAFGKVVWDETLERPTMSLVEQPRNLWCGYGSNDYTKLEWACYSYFITPMQAVEDYGLDVETREHDGGSFEESYRYVYVQSTINHQANDPQVLSNREWLQTPQWGMLQVNDYWFRQPKGPIKRGKRTAMETRNIITVGNYVVKDEVHSEYDGLLPYVPVFNTFIPGVPEGRPDLYDVEHLLREKDERVSAGGTMVSKLTGKQFWQLTGPESPDRVPTGLKPEADKVVAPGAGNRIEAITPWMPEFQLEQYLARIDRELQDVSGLNDLLRGLAPSQVLSSGKAINALVANYEARITLRRQMFYQWRIDTWGIVKTVWGNKVGMLKDILENAGKLVVKSPSLTPRDDLEQATLAMNLMNAKVWSLARAMDSTGVEDPEDEQNDVRKERQDAALFPADVQAQAALMAMMQQMQMQQQQAAAQQGGPGSGPLDDEAALEAEEARRVAGDTATPNGQEQLQGEEEQAVPPEGSSAFAGEGDFNAVNQTMLMEGQPTNRTLLQQPLTDEGQG
jgi:hypothetical protein